MTTPDTNFDYSRTMRSGLSMALAMPESLCIPTWDFWSASRVLVPVKKNKRHHR